MITVQMNLRPCHICGATPRVNQGHGPDDDFIIAIQCPTVTCPNQNPPRRFGRTVSTQGHGWQRRINNLALDMAEAWNDWAGEDDPLIPELRDEI